MGGQIDGWILHDHAGGQGEVQNRAAAQPIGVVGQDGTEEQDHPPGVQGGRVQEHGDQPLEHTGDQQLAIASGQGGGDRQTRDGEVQGDSTSTSIVDHQAVVGDGFQQEFRKIIRAGRKRKVPDGTVQMLLSKFVGRGAGPSTISNNCEKKRKVVQNVSLGIKKFKP